ncbi:MAG: chemotaxis protein CheD [Mangrovibacterium sp.]
MKVEHKYHLYPSALVVLDGGWITTLLGSCVAVCLYDKRRKSGGMNHYMLPFWNGEGLETPRYGNVAIPRLIVEMLDHGCLKKNMVAKIFGGASLLTEDGFFQVGEKNVLIARRLLREFGIPLIASSTGGNKGRRIFLNAGTGEVFLQYIDKQSAYGTKE